MAAGDTGGGNCPPLLAKDDPRDSLKTEKKMGGIDKVRIVEKDTRSRGHN